MGKPVPALWGCRSLRQAGAQGTPLDEPRGPWGARKGTDPSRDAWKTKQNFLWRTPIRELVQTLLKQPYLLGYTPSPPVTSHAIVLTVKILGTLRLSSFTLTVWGAGRLKQIHQEKKIKWWFAVLSKKYICLANVIVQDAGSREGSSVLLPWRCSQPRAGQPSREGGRERSLTPQIWSLGKTSPVFKTEACGGWKPTHTDYKGTSENVVLTALPVGIPTPDYVVWPRPFRSFLW